MTLWIVTVHPKVKAVVDEEIKKIAVDFHIRSVFLDFL